MWQALLGRKGFWIPCYGDFEGVRYRDAGPPLLDLLKCAPAKFSGALVNGIERRFLLFIAYFDSDGVLLGPYLPGHGAACGYCGVVKGRLGDYNHGLCQACHYRLYDNLGCARCRKSRPINVSGLKPGG